MNIRLFAISILILFYSHNGIAADKTECKKSEVVQVSGASVLASELVYRQTRQSLLEGLLVEAATIVNGAEITTRRTIQTNVINDEMAKTHSKYDAVKARGVVLSYSFPVDAEHISESTLGKMLNLTVDVEVCDQSNIEPPIYIAIDDIVLKKFEEAEGESLTYVVAGAIPTNSNLRYVRDVETTPYRDFIISGQILSVAATVERSRWKATVGQMILVNGEPIAKEVRVVRLSAIIELKAYNVAQDSYTLISKTIEDKLPWQESDAALAQRVDEFIVASLHEASVEIYKKIIRNEDFDRVGRL